MSERLWVFSTLPFPFLIKGRRRNRLINTGEMMSLTSVMFVTNFMTMTVTTIVTPGTTRSFREIQPAVFLPGCGRPGQVLLEGWPPRKWMGICQGRLNHGLSEESI